MDYMFVLLLPLLVGLVSGFASGLFGIGGGAIRIPLLNLVGFPLVSAYGANFFALPLSCSIGAYTQRQNVDRKLGAYMIIGGTIGTIVGTVIAFSLSASALLMAILFVTVSVMVVLGMNLSRIAPHASEKISPSGLALSLGTFGANTLGAMKGGSGGSLFGPLLKTFNIEIHRAIATALFVAAFTSIVGTLLYWSQGELLVIEGLAVLAGSMIGSRLGSLISIDAKPKWLEAGLSVVILALAAMTLVKAMFP
ncbi:sulfite exporter TauE/SafE family protein [Candidatus Thorarchaeota archaeon]|nr:MAG: sulfite exporter TauE/SafE family protein [Candidatus Thorarchaeota archaeon]